MKGINRYRISRIKGKNLNSRLKGIRFINGINYLISIIKPRPSFQPGGIINKGEEEVIIKPWGTDNTAVEGIKSWNKGNITRIWDVLK